MHWLKIGFQGFVVIYLLSIIGVYLFQRAIIFQEKKLPEDYVFQFSHPFEELTIPTADSICLNALFFKTELPSKGAVLYLHGNADNLQRWAQYHEAYTVRGYDFLAIDYRGYGKSEGKPSYKGLLTDAQAAYDWIRHRYPPDSLIIVGRSLGTGLASALAASYPAKQLILETPYDDLRHAMMDRSWLWLPFPIQHPFRTAEHLPKVEYPVCIFHGTRDKVIPFQSADRLQPILKERDLFVVIPKAGHKDFTGFPQYGATLDKILGN